MIDALEPCPDCGSMQHKACKRPMTEASEGMTIEQLQGWMKLINTSMLELILTVGAGKPQWYKDAMIAEIQRRKESRDDRQGSNENTFRPE